MQHLGGHMWNTHVDLGVLTWLYMSGFRTSLIDVGCGPAGNVIAARNLGFVDAIGIDGDPALQQLNKAGRPKLIHQHDYTFGPLIKEGFDDFQVGFSTEFLEHVSEEYLPAIMDTFQRCGIVICTHALPGETGGHHHVNLKSEEWWIKKFKKYGFTLSEDATHDVRLISSMEKDFMRKTGKVFLRD